MESLRILVCGLLGRNPVGGWHYLQYLAGLSKLGHDVYYYEDTRSWPYHPIECTNTSDGTYSAKYIADFLRSFCPSVSEKWLYRHLGKTYYGLSEDEFASIASSADIFLNIGGTSWIPDNLTSACTKVFVDTDPGYNQIVLSERPEWSENVDLWHSIVSNHDLFFTYGENIHAADCIVPQLDFRWQTTRPPVVMELWREIADRAPPAEAPWTTIMTWNDFKGRLSHRGREYGSKGEEFEKLMDLPNRVRVPFKIAVGGPKAPLARLTEHGWQAVDGPATTIAPASYRDFLLGSRGEISAAKNVYVAMRTGWFSERTTCYLASGRPAVVQDTGFRNWLPVGNGLMTFTTVEEAAEAIRRVEADYTRHAAMAARVAEEHFDSSFVLARLIEKIRSASG